MWRSRTFKRKCPSNAGKKPKENTVAEGDSGGHSGDKHSNNVMFTAHAFMSESSPLNDWIIDSAAWHMTASKNHMLNYQPFHRPEKVNVGDGSILEAFGSGDIPIQSFVGDDSMEITMKNVMYVPRKAYNLFSVAAAVSRGNTEIWT